MFRSSGVRRASARPVELRVLHDGHEVGTGEPADFHDFIKFLLHRRNFRGASETSKTGDLPDIRECEIREVRGIEAVFLQSLFIAPGHGEGEGFEPFGGSVEIRTGERKLSAVVDVDDRFAGL